MTGITYVDTLEQFVIPVIARIEERGQSVILLRDDAILFSQCGTHYTTDF